MKNKIITHYYVKEEKKDINGEAVKSGDIEHPYPV